MNPLIIAARLIAPFLILLLPLPGGFLSVWLDNVDWHHKVFLGINPVFDYQTVDKILDTYYQFFLLIVALQWKNKVAKRILIGLFVYRLIGFVLFEVTQIRTFLFFFPNLYENFFFFYLLVSIFLSSFRLKNFNPKQILKVLSPKLPIEPTFTKLGYISILVILLIPKMMHEYSIHIIQKQLVITIGEFVYRYEGTHHQQLYILAVAFIASLLQKKIPQKEKR